jgi:uncharacterized protein (DUF1501 family)
MLNRRHLIQAAAAAPLFTAGRLYAAPATGPRLLVVFLRGAYDAANIVIPTGSDFYYTARPNLAVAKDAALPLETGWGLHPALKAEQTDRLHSLCRDRRHLALAFRDPGHHRVGPACRRPS